MADNFNVMQLTPLDLIMPGTYVQALLTFETEEPTSSALQKLQDGLEGLSKQIPWLTGRVFPTTGQQKPSLQIRWVESAEAPKIIDNGSIPGSYEALSVKGMPPGEIPPSVWPTPNLVGDAFAKDGAPVLTASIFRFSDNKGVGLCICVHHNVTDAAGFSEVLKLWAERVTVSGSGSPITSGARLAQLSDGLATDSQAISDVSLESLFAAHPEYSSAPPSLPSEFPPSTSKVFTIPISRVNSLKESLGQRMGAAPTTNTLLSALVWQAVTRARIHRKQALADKTSRLVMAVNGRQRIADDFSTPENPYLGNAVLYALTELGTQDSRTPFGQGDADSLAEICGSITRSQSPSRIDRRHIAEVCSLVRSVDDYKTVFPGWDLFNSRDLTITSWLNLPLYDLEFGQDLGKPGFVRVPYLEADGVGIILPRRATEEAGRPDGVFDVMVMLRRDDMEILEKDNLWGDFRS